MPPTKSDQTKPQKSFAFLKSKKTIPSNTAVNEENQSSNIINTQGQSQILNFEEENNMNNPSI